MDAFDLLIGFVGALLVMLAIAFAVPSEIDLWDEPE